MDSHDRYYAAIQRYVEHTNDLLRRDTFLANHPEWKLAFVRSTNYWEAIKIDLTGETILTDYRLPSILDKMEKIEKPTDDNDEIA